MLPDYHIHTILCKHACGKPEEYVRMALSKGLSEIGFSDHCPWPQGFDPNFRMRPEQFHEYRTEICKLQAQFPDFPIRYGLEIDWVPGKMEEVFSNINTEDFDYIIGSVHYVGDFPFDNPDFAEQWKEQGRAEKVWQNYFKILDEMLLSRKIDIIGHFDLPKKFGVYPNNYEEMLDGQIACTLKIASDVGTTIELNSSGLRKPVGEIYPNIKILRLAKKLGVKITFGSDAHNPHEVGANFDKSVVLAKEAGYDEFSLFRKRKIFSAKLN